MKLGIGIKGDNRLNKDYIRYAVQIGAPYTSVFMPDTDIFAHSDVEPWSFDDLNGLKKYYAEQGAKIEGFENFHPSAIYKILLDMPGKEQQMDYVKRCIDNMGKAKIPVMGYNFSLAGVVARDPHPARGGAETVRFDPAKAPINESMPLGIIFNRVVMPDAPEGVLPFVSMDEMVERRDWFLGQILPVAEEAGVKMAAHPEDPPIPVLRNTSRILINKPAYEDMFKKFDSPSNCIEFCQGTFAEMGVDVYDTIEYFAKKDKIGYVHFRNISGLVSTGYTEEFIDDGDIDMVRAIKAYRDGGYTGMLMPDHTPNVSVDNPTAVGMAYAVGYIRGIMNSLGVDIED